VLFFHTPPNYSLLKVFGCTCWPHLRPYNKQKLSFRSKECVFLGFSSLHKGYKCLDTDSGRVYISRDIIFDENVFPFKRASLNSSPTLQPMHNAPHLCTLRLGNSSTNLENDHMHIFVPTYSLDVENLVPASASELQPQSSMSLPCESTLVVLPMIRVSDPPPADNNEQCLVGSSAAGRPTAIAPVTPLVTTGTAVPSVRPTFWAHGPIQFNNYKNKP